MGVDSGAVARQNADVTDHDPGRADGRPCSDPGRADLGRPEGDGPGGGRDGFVVIGPGAIGGAIAGALIQAGHEPALVMRTPFTTLDVTLPDGSVRAPVRALTDPSAARPVDHVIVAVKAHQTGAIAPWLDALVDDATTVSILQNGVEHLERFGPLVAAGAELVPVVVALPAQRTGPGSVVVGGRARLTAPVGPGGDHLAAALAASFVDVVLTEDWVSAAWTKLMLNAASGGICVFAGSSNAIFATDGEAAALALLLMEEVAAVGRAEGARLAADLPETVLRGLLDRAGGHRSSIVVDRLEGRPIEWDARNAVVGRLAERHGIDVPLNRLLTTLLRLSEPAPD